MKNRGNLERIVYIGDRQSVGKEWNRRRYVFRRENAIAVPEAFAEILLATFQFVREDEFGRPLAEVHPDGGRILFRRWGALGDLLMFRAATAAFLKLHPGYEPVLRCQERFAPIMAVDPIWHAVVAIGGKVSPAVYDCDAVFTFDQVAEADHRGRHEHRVELFLQAMAHETINVTAEDWQLPIPSAAQTWVRRHLEARGLLRDQRGEPLIAFQHRGSGKMKSIPDHIGGQIVARLTDGGASVILTEPEEAATRKLVEVSDTVHTMTGRDALHGIELMKHCDLAIVMDSAPLWMAHCANCPVVAILGPTRAAQRISMHPQYPAGARAVALNELIDCPACFEAAEACKGTFACMQKQPDWGRAVEMIVGEVERALAGEVSLPCV